LDLGFWGLPRIVLSVVVHAEGIELIKKKIAEEWSHGFG
jgi:hypothetical protein